MSESEYLGDPSGSDDPPKWHTANPGGLRHLSRESSTFPSRHRQTPSYVPPFYQHGRNESLTDPQAQHYRTQSAGDLSFLQSPHQSPYIGESTEVQQQEQQQQQRQQQQQQFSVVQTLPASMSTTQVTNLFSGSQQGSTSGSPSAAHHRKGSVSKTSAQAASSKSRSHRRSQSIFKLNMPNIISDNYGTDTNRLHTQQPMLPPLSSLQNIPSQGQPVQTKGTQYEGISDMPAKNSSGSMPQSEICTPSSENYDHPAGNVPGPVVWNPSSIYETTSPDKKEILPTKSHHNYLKKNKRYSKGQSEHEALLTSSNLLAGNQQQPGIGLGIDIHPPERSHSSNLFSPELENTEHRNAQVLGASPQHASYSYGQSTSMEHNFQPDYELKPRENAISSKESGSTNVTSSGDNDARRSGVDVSSYSNRIAPIQAVSHSVAGGEPYQNPQLTTPDMPSLLGVQQQPRLTPQMLTGWTPQVDQYANAPRPPYVPYSQIARLEQQQQHEHQYRDKSQYKGRFQEQNQSSQQLQNPPVSVSPKHQPHVQNPYGQQFLANVRQNPPQHSAEGGIGLYNSGSSRWAQDPSHIHSQKPASSSQLIAGPSNAPTSMLHHNYQQYQSNYGSFPDASGNIRQRLTVPEAQPYSGACTGIAFFEDSQSGQDDTIMMIPSDNYSPAARDMQWTNESIFELMKILEPAERYKWKYISELLSRRQNKRIPLRACKQKFEALFGEAEASSLLKSSLFYVAYRSGWDTIKNVRTIEEIDDSSTSSENKSSYGEGREHGQSEDNSATDASQANPTNHTNSGASVNNPRSTLSDDSELLKAEMSQYEAQMAESGPISVMRPKGNMRSSEFVHRSDSPHLSKAPGSSSKGGSPKKSTNIPQGSSSNIQES